MRLVIAILLATMSFPAFAQDNSNTQEIDFEALDIDGEMVKPSIIFTGVNTGPRFNPLIELRYDFNLEMSQSVNDIK
jgi:hypothetical protein